MAHERAQPGVIEQGAALDALISPVRQEIVDTIESIGGDVAVADIAAQLGRPADGLYYHLRRLVDAGVLREGADPGDDRGRRYRTVAAPGKRLRVKYGRGAASDPDAVARLVAGLLRTAERDFAKAVRSGAATGDGEQRDLWASRIKGWVGAAELREINRLLVRLFKVFQHPRSEHRDRLVALAWVLAPIDDKPLRRSPPATASRKRAARRDV